MTTPERRGGRGGFAVGAILIGIGVVLLVERFTSIDLAEAGWPLFVIVPGLALLAWGLTISGREGVGLAVGGGITTVVGLILAVQNLTGLWATWAYAWALVGPGGSGLGMLAHGLTHRDQGLVTNGLRSLGTGLALFVAFGLFFEGIVGLSGRPFLSTDVGPYLLIGVGVIIVLAGLIRGRPRPA